MTLQKRFPLDTDLTNGSQFATVFGYRDDGMLDVEGIGPSAKLGNWFIHPGQCRRISKNHFGFTDVYEYFVVDMILYRALKTNPIVGNNEQRNGGRPVMSTHLLTSEYLKELGLKENK